MRALDWIQKWVFRILGVLVEAASALLARLSEARSLSVLAGRQHRSEGFADEVAGHTYPYRSLPLTDALDELVRLGLSLVEVWLGHAR